MLGFKNNRKTEFVLVLEERSNFYLVLTSLAELLRASGNNAQSSFIYKLIELLNQNDLSQFVKLINGVDMWGGAGAVWETYLSDKKAANEFEREMLNLINLMEKSEIIGKGVRPIKKILENSLRTG